MLLLLLCQNSSQGPEGCVRHLVQVLQVLQAERHLDQAIAKMPTQCLKGVDGHHFNIHFPKKMWFPRKTFKLEYLSNRESFLRTSNAESTIRVSAITGQEMTQLTSNHFHGKTADCGGGLR